MGITRRLRINWHLNESEVEKVLFERGKEYLKEKLKKNILSEREEYILSTESEDDKCPYIIEYIDNPDDISRFEVEISVYSLMPQNEKNQSCKIFICYVEEDLNLALKLYDGLKSINMKPWLDKKDLMVGEKWENAIRTAIKESDYFIVLLSSNSVNKKGFVNKELKMALDILDEFPEDGIFILPLQLDQCEIPHRLKKLYHINVSLNWKFALEKVQEVLRRNTKIAKSYQ